MTSSDMQDTPAGRRADGADGRRASQPKRRTFTDAYKLAMIEKYDAAAEPGAKGALLRGEGLYDSHISYWRKARDSGGLRSSAPAVPGKDSKPMVFSQSGKTWPPASTLRDPAELAPAADDIKTVTAAIHHPADAITLIAATRNMRR